MINKNVDTEVLEEFYSQLPDTLISDTLNAMEMSLKRKIDTNHKTNMEKVKIINQEKETQHVFIEILFYCSCHYYSKQYDEISSLKFMDILEIINEKNNIYCIIYLLKNYYNEYGDELQKRRIIKFMQSKEFKNFISKKSIGKYLCIIEKSDIEYFIPAFLIKDFILEPINLEQFSAVGNVHIYFKDLMQKDNFLKNEYIKFNHKLWVFEFDDSEELEDNINLNTGKLRLTNKKIDGNFLIDKGRITSIKDENIYEIVKNSENVTNFNEIKIQSKPISDSIFFKSRGYVYGPYSYYKKDNAYLLRPRDGYTLEKISVEKCNIYNLKVKGFDIEILYLNGYKTITAIEKKIGELENISAEKQNKIKELDVEIIGLEKTSVEKQNDIYRINIDKEQLEEASTKKQDEIQELENREDELKKILIQIQNEIYRLRIYEKQLEEDSLEKLNKLNKLSLDIMHLEEISINRQNEILELGKSKEKLEEAIAKKQGEIHKINLDKEQLEIILSGRQNEAENIEKELISKLTNIIQQATNIAFDGMLSNKMLVAASEWERSSYKDNYEELVKEINKISTCHFQDVSQTREYIYNNIKKYRPDYTNNDITNFMICISNGFLTVLAGDPGVGKTSICNIISKTLGLHLIKDALKDTYSHIGHNISLDVNRYIVVSVEKGWTSKRDFIGYYNPLTKSFDKSNSALFSALNILDLENKNKFENLPFYILLDEANLSSMEHYWADFMNVCDFDSDSRSVNIGEDYIYDIPRTLRFLATINYDHTTEALSPRLIDRSWIIMMETKNDYIHSVKSIKNIKNEPEKIISFKELETIFCNPINNSIQPDIDIILSEIYTLFEKQNISVSGRIRGMIQKYMIVGQDLFESDNGTNGNTIALDYVISQKLLPKIDGYGESYEMFLSNLKDYCAKNNMKKCKNTLEKILDKGKRNMDYYQFFS